MSPDALLAAAAGALGVLATWEALAAVERARVVSALGDLVAPLVRARQEGREPTAPERRRLRLLAAATLAAGGWLISGPLAGAALAAAGPWLSVTVVRVRRRRYRAELARGAPLVARAIADALAGGHSIRGAIGAAAGGGGIPGPAGAELSAAAAALALGEPTDVVLDRLRRAGGGPPFDTIVAAMLLQREAGGDLARLLRGIAGALDESRRLHDDARSATAQARFTGFVVTALPAGAALLAELASPGYLGRLLQAPLTAWLLGCALMFQALALVLIGRLARVRA